MTSTATFERPKFTPIPCPSSSLVPPLYPSWLPVTECPAKFPLDMFEIAASQLIHHPEYNSTLILRSEVISETTPQDQDFPVLSDLNGFTAVKCIHRKLLPRRPTRDPALEQYCTLYTKVKNKNEEAQLNPSVLVLTPILEDGASLPFYHPTVRHIAFRYIPSTEPLLRVEVSPLPSTALDPSSRLYRTSLALLETLHRYMWGALSNYKKRVQHDCLVGRDEYQDLYLVMRERHKGLVNTWQEVTDPLKHVFEDIGIATYLMLLWKYTFDSRTHDGNVNLQDEPWKTWPRPPGGFIDFGCGNGLLTHILVSEGYIGFGIDLRARSSWSHYSKNTRDALKVYAFDPTTIATDADDLDLETYFKPDVFIIGNHSDELTPWLPVLATLYESAGYISIPCCSWAFDKKYERSSTETYLIPSNWRPIPGMGAEGEYVEPATNEEFVESLNLGGEGSNKSSYSQYRIWLASLAMHCGWQVECETLRIPSTRNWAVIGRKRLRPNPKMHFSEGLDEEEDEYLHNVRIIVEEVKSRGLFKTRRPEGKVRDH